MSELQAISPLVAQRGGQEFAAWETPQLTLCELPPRTLVGLRTHLQQVAAVHRALPGRLPEKPLCSVAGDPGALWLAPDAWLLYSATQSALEMQQDLAASLAGILHLCTDQSAAMTPLGLHGRAAANLLSRGCGLDFSAAGFPPGHCARTRFAHFPLLLLRPGAAPVFELFIDRSYAAALWNWLVRHMGESINS